MPRLQVRRGLFADLPTTDLLQGEVLYSYDRGTLHIAQSPTVATNITPAVEALPEMADPAEPTDLLMITDASATGQKERKMSISAFKQLSTPWSALTGTPTTVLGYGITDAVTTGDARLTDAREWTAETVEEAEAIAGTATTRRAWTAQRVRKAAYYVETGFRDLLAPLSNAGIPQNQAPSHANFVVGTVTRREYGFVIGNLLYVTPFHINHDVKPGGKAYIHVHWSTNGTQTNTVRWQLDITRALGHNQGAASTFTQVPSITLEQAASGIAYQHMVVEASEAQVLTLVEPDELIMVNITRVTNGGTNNTDTVFGLQVDLHYEVDRHVTPNKAPNFYG